jgi:hypothetical protein
MFVNKLVFIVFESLIEKVTDTISRTKAVTGFHVNLITITNSSSDHSCIFIY